MKMRCVLAAALLTGAGLVPAEAPAPEPAPQTKASVPAQRDKDDTRQPAPAEAGEFHPSEEISADSTVSFPVDI